jgi:demethylmenaquinone methyltransferase/2-methoxy-6-polyprenyl-1,4-benzoquinol methylase
MTIMPPKASGRDPTGGEPRAGAAAAAGSRDAAEPRESEETVVTRDAPTDRVDPDGREPDDVEADAVELDGEPRLPDGSRRGNPVPEADVRAMFDEIAPVYDRLNTLMTAGRDRSWRQAAVRATGLGNGDTAIDVACGTGRVAAALAEVVGPFGRVVGVDLAARMIERATAEYRDIVQLEFRVGNALALPFENGEFDAGTICFGLRNLADFESGFREMRRVVRPGGRVVCLELTVPRPRVWGRVFRTAFRRLAPFAGSLLGAGETYRYLPASLEGFPSADRLAETMRTIGFSEVRYRRLGLGSVALHVGRVPEA